MSNCCYWHIEFLKVFTRQKKKQQQQQQQTSKAKILHFETDLKMTKLRKVESISESTRQSLLTSARFLNPFPSPPQRCSPPSLRLIKVNEKIASQTLGKR